MTLDKVTFEEAMRIVKQVPRWEWRINDSCTSTSIYGTVKEIEAQITSKLFENCLSLSYRGIEFFSQSVVKGQEFYDLARVHDSEIKEVDLRKIYLEIQEKGPKLVREILEGEGK